MLDNLYQLLNLKTILVGIATAVFVYWARRRLKYSYPPGPLALPLFGNILYFKNTRLHEQFLEWSHKYGPIISVSIGPLYFVVLNDMESVTEAMVKKGEKFSNRIVLPSIKVLSYDGRNILSGQYGPTWKLLRSIATKALRHYMMGEALENRVHDAVSTAFVEMKKEAAPFDPKCYINFIVGNFLTGLCFGGQYTFDDPELRNVIQSVDEFNQMAVSGFIEDLVPGFQYVWESKKFRRGKELVRELFEIYIGTKLREHKRTFDKDNLRDFTDTLILARQEAEDDPSETNLEKLTDLHLINAVANIFFAGLDASRFTLRWAILHMAAYPEIQNKVQEEIDRVVGFDDMPRSQHRADLSYTEAVLYESMRLSTVPPFGVPHVTSCDTSLGSFNLPKGTNVIINHWALHHDPQKWDNVSEFRPERYLENGKLGTKPLNWLPFSIGRRACLGEMIAKPELLFTFACLMQRFKWSVPEGETVDLTPTESVILIVPKDHKLVITDRKPQ